MSQLPALEREAKLTRDFIAELKGLTPRFNALKERAEEELALHLAKIDAERAKLAELIDAAALIVQHLGAEVPEVAEVAEVCEADEAPEIVAMIDSPPEDPPGAFLTLPDEPGPAPVPEPSFEYVAAAVAQIADEAPATDDQSDAPEMTDHEVERLQDQRLEQTLAALDEDARELEPVGDAPRARPFMSFAKANPFA